MTAIKQAPLVEYVLTKAPVDRIFSDIRPCSGCAFRYDDDKCIEQTECVSMGEIYVWSIVPAGFNDTGIEPSKPEDFQPSESAWAIHIPGPDEIYAAPSEGVARHMAARHNAAMTAYFERNPDSDGFGPSRSSCMAVVVQYPWSADDHSEALADFSHSEWGLVDPEASHA